MGAIEYFNLDCTSAHEGAAAKIIKVKVRDGEHFSA
jgi:hypothetical protein